MAMLRVVCGCLDAGLGTDGSDLRSSVGSTMTFSGQELRIETGPPARLAARELMWLLHEFIRGAGMP